MFYRVLFYYFDEFVAVYENRFERENGYFRSVIQEVVEKYLDCGKEDLLKYFKAVTGRELTPGIIAVIQSFGSRISLHPHLHFPLTEGRVDKS